MARNDPLRNHRFRLEIEGIEQAGFTEVSGLDVSIQPIEYREGADVTRVRKLTGLTKYANITLKWGITDSTELHDWFRQVADGDIRRRSVVVILMDESGEDRARWEVREAWPCRYSVSGFEANGSEVAIETLELCHEGLERAS